MTIELTPEHQRMIERVMHSRAYHDAQEVISAALGKLAEDVDERNGRPDPPTCGSCARG
jgi:Arc/MetJ-type ribon-helix-helix transcriptional regulator